MGEFREVPGKINRRKLALGAGTVLLALLLFGCQVGRIQNGVFIYDEKGFKVNLLSQDWIRKKEPGFDLFYYNSRNSATIGVASQCGPPTRAPLSILTRHLLFGLKDVQVMESREWKLAEGSASESIVEASLNEIKVKMSLVVIKRQGCIYDLEYVARPDSFEESLETFHRMVESFSLL